MQSAHAFRDRRELTQEPPSGAGDDPRPEAASRPGDPRTHAPAAVQSLKQAMRRARHDNAERSGVMDDLRAARLGRLEMLQEALRPLIAQIPPDVDLFDVGVMPGANPRLFIDMIGFVEMGRDARVYHFVQDTRHGRLPLAETSDIDGMVDAVTDYVARRLLERDKALASDMGDAARSYEPTARTPETAYRPARRPPPPRRRRSPLHGLSIAFAFLIDLLGSIAFFTILAAIGWIVYNKMHTPL